MRADKAPLILAFLSDLFDGVTEVPFERARSELELIYRGEGVADPSTNARLALNNWIDDGLLREQGQKLTMTSKAELALKFVDGLDSRDMLVTESHLETVSEEIRRLLVVLSPDIEERKRVIEEQIRELEAAKDRLAAGLTPELSDAQRRERVRHLYNQAIRLTQDFRFLEDEMRQHADTIRKQILDDQESRGSVMEGVLDAEDAMRQSPAGMAFDGFYSMLADAERSLAFRAQIKRLMKLGIAEYLTKDESRYLGEMVTELLNQSSRVIERRRAATESLKAYMTSGAQEEHRAVDRLIKQAMQLAVRLKGKFPQGSPEWNMELPLILRTGKVRVGMPSLIKVSKPAESLEMTEIVEHVNGTELSDASLKAMDGVSIHAVASEVRDVLRTSGSRTLAELSFLRPVKRGVAEVMALIRIAITTQAQRFGESDTEQFSVVDLDGTELLVTVPTFVLSYEKFPEDMSTFSA